MKKIILYAFLGFAATNDAAVAVEGETPAAPVTSAAPVTANTPSAEKNIRRIIKTNGWETYIEGIIGTGIMHVFQRILQDKTISTNKSSSSFSGAVTWNNDAKTDYDRIMRIMRVYTSLSYKENVLKLKGFLKLCKNDFGKLFSGAVEKLLRQEKKAAKAAKTAAAGAATEEFRHELLAAITLATEALAMRCNRYKNFDVPELKRFFKEVETNLLTPKLQARIKKYSGTSSEGGISAIQATKLGN
ncbi:MAG: hypothetical protein LBO73_03005 [Holosporaceae bacterium]|jgi:flagellar hook-basal body complex protein FliE|nr:hypothetical protein [Holosporaceae bacterium]